MQAFIYILCHPITGEIRYVGKTNNPKRRLSMHKKENRNTRKNAWIKSLSKVGLEPEMEILEQFPHEPDSNWQESEKFWISYLRFIGCNLTNLDGGGSSGFLKSEESRRKISMSNTGKKMSPEAIAKMKATKAANMTSEVRERLRAAQLGKKQSQETIAKRSAALRGRIVSDETRRKIGDANRGFVMSEIQKENLRKFNLGKVASPETRAKLSASNKGRKPSPQTLAASREARLGRKTSEETKAKQRAAKLGKELSSEHRASLSAAQKLRWQREKMLAINPVES